jgi:hypothetical protein
MNKEKQILPKPVIKVQDMDPEMFKEVEKLARETYENKFIDEMVFIINILKYSQINRKLRILLKRNWKKNMVIEIYAGM